MNTVTIHCASPSCGATLEATLLPDAMRIYGWRLQEQPGDDVERPYCPRCQEA